MRFSFVFILLLIHHLGFSQLSGKERADSARLASKARIDSIRSATVKRNDSIKKVTQARKDSILATRKSNTKKLNDDKNTFSREELNNQKKLRDEARRDSIANAKKENLEKRKQESIAKRNSQASKRPLKIPPISQELGLGYRFNTDGWSFFANRGFINTSDPEKNHTRYVWAELSEKKNLKERLSQNENFQSTNPNEIKPLGYKYGKINNFYAFKLGYGNSKPITGRLDQNSMVISWTYQAGISLGMLKPYYLDLLIREGNTFVRRMEKYSESTRESFLDLKNQGTIIGGSDFTKGLNEIKLKPGFIARSGFYFDYSWSKKSFIGVEIGASMEAYTEKIPIMIITDAKAVFFNLYVDIRFGRRWKKNVKSNSESEEYEF